MGESCIGSADLKCVVVCMMSTPSIDVHVCIVLDAFVE